MNLLYSCVKSPYLYGGFAQKIVIPAGFWLHKLPDNVPLDVGALAEPLAVAVRAIERIASPGTPHMQMGLGIGTSVLVQGAGSIGLLVAICAKLSGAKVTILDKIQERLDLAKSIGIKNTFNVTRESSDQLIERIKDMDNGIGPDAVIEATGELDSIPFGLKLLRRGGKYLELGNFVDVGNISIKPSFICQNDLEFVGSVLGSPQDYSRVMYILSESGIPFKRLITHRFDLEHTENAILNAKARNGLKSIILPNGENYD